MKILIVNNMSPFVWGGAEELAVNLKKNLIIAGHDAEILRIPFQWEPALKIPSQMLMVKGFELLNTDRIIALKFPAYLINHPQKTLWLLHQYRQAYDLYDAKQTNLTNGNLGDDIRNLITKADNMCFAECRKIYTNSEITKDRLFKYNNVISNVLLPPLNDPELFTGGKNENYIFSGGRINNMKRQFMLIEAMNKTPKRVKLIIAGPPDGPSDAIKLKSLVEKYSLQDRVKLDLRFLPRQSYADYINHASAVAYIPYDEDSLGYVTMEAATAGKALISTSDSGGIQSLVKNLDTGWLAEANVDSLADAMDSVWENTSITTNYGVAARVRWLSHNITWQNTVEALLQ